MAHPPPKDDTNKVTQQIRAFFDQKGTIPEAIIKFQITRASAKHYHLEWKQARGIGGSGQHAEAKVRQALSLLDAIEGNRVVEFFAGSDGHLSAAYEQAGAEVLKLDKRLGTGDSQLTLYRLFSERKTFDLVDLDPYGYVVRFFPAVFSLIQDGGLLLSLPKPGCNHSSHITWQMLKAHFGKKDPDVNDVLDTLWWWGISLWREIELFDIIDFGRMWRIALRVKRVKATEYMGVRNRPGLPPMQPAMREPPKWAATQPTPFEEDW